MGKASADRWVPGMYSAMQIEYCADRACTTQQWQVVRASAQGECAYTGCTTWAHIDDGQRHMQGIDRSQCHKRREADVEGSAATGTSPSSSRSERKVYARWCSGATSTTRAFFESVGHTSKTACTRPSDVGTDNMQKTRARTSSAQRSVGGAGCVHSDPCMPTESRG